ncbi:shikimate dehydrogenase family protein [Nonomuraea jiangxiensis]|uniref:Shikimate 5-dehydrogenase n=1 Tax=Nonomuraea jiangxiensis TaxID=633440 RepID=A0A1G8QJX5_9ACTN|nr:shikimate dehydrogenase [Nonomuraea jiangxiensis]SDJ04883.1 Shikimate 5-dehydrogenase [Nonomuraea jiangxiensis]
MSALGFVGVDTGGSSIQRIFPRWARALGLPEDRLVGYDIPLGAPDEEYVRVVERIRDDDGIAGALVTTHKIRILEAAGHLFDSLDVFAREGGEISSIAKRDGRLVGHALDPLTARLSLEEFVPEGHFARTGAQVVCLGAGGAGTAITWYLAGRDDRPARITITDTDPRRLRHVREVHERAGLPAQVFSYVPADGPADELVAAAPPGSLIVNATGMGKDRPGSPLGPSARLPEHGLIWELNYRGTLEFLITAREQEERLGLTVVDGWRYFIHGWTQVIAEVFDLRMDSDLVERLARLVTPPAAGNSA